jgi:hypothetical protein
VFASQTTELGNTKPFPSYLEQMTELAYSKIFAPLRLVNQTYYILGKQFAYSIATFK